MRRLVVNDCLSTLGEHTFWHDLVEWLDAEFVGGDYATLADTASSKSADAGLIVRNGSWFPPIKADCPQIALVQDIFITGPQRDMQHRVMEAAHTVVYNSAYTQNQYATHPGRVIPLPVDFKLFEPGNAMGLQQALSLPDGCVCWIGASQGAAGQVKGWDIMLQIARLNPDLNFVCVFKDAAPEYTPPNMRCYTRLSQDELVRVIGACRVGLCTSRTESQHLAGIEIGACGLPLVVPPVGTYWQRRDMPGVIVEKTNTDEYREAIRSMLNAPVYYETNRNYWRKEFDKPVIKAQWMKLVSEVERA